MACSVVESSLRNRPGRKSGPVLTIEQIRGALNGAGLREYVLEAPRLTQLPGQSGPGSSGRCWTGTSRRSNPRVRLLAERGWVPPKPVGTPRGEVVMTRTAESGKPPATIITRDVLVRPPSARPRPPPPPAVTPGATCELSACAPFWMRNGWNCFPK